MIKSCWTKSERWRDIEEKGMAGRQKAEESQEWKEKSRRRGKKKKKKRKSDEETTNGISSNVKLGVVVKPKCTKKISLANVAMWCPDVHIYIYLTKIYVYIYSVIYKNVYKYIV